MTATDAMLTILDINEVSEKIKQENMERIPNLDWCKANMLLSGYRELLLNIMDNTELNIGGNNGRCNS